MLSRLIMSAWSVIFSGDCDGPERGRSSGGRRLCERAAVAACRALRRVVERLFVRLFRNYSSTAVAAFAHLGLVALDLEQLRWGLVQRRAFPSVDQVTP